MSEIQIILSENVTTEQCRAVRLYLDDVNQLSSRDWRTALEGFDSLRSSVVCIDGEKFTFEIFYKLFVEQRYTDQFIQRIYNEPNLEQTGRRIQASIAREILHRLSEEGLSSRHIVNSEYLASYLLYWWAAFAKGYLFELSIFRDLESTGIQFVAHDIRTRQGRFSPSDLFVEGLAGDIKNTTYFLYSSRSFPLTNDFYITRLYDEKQRKYLPIVIMKPAAWQFINGDILPCSFQEAANFLPQTVQVDFEGARINGLRPLRVEGSATYVDQEGRLRLTEGLVVVDYNVWKQKILSKQRRQRR